MTQLEFKELMLQLRERCNHGNVSLTGRVVLFNPKVYAEILKFEVWNRLESTTLRIFGMDILSAYIVQDYILGIQIENAIFVPMCPACGENVAGTFCKRCGETIPKLLTRVP